MKHKRRIADGYDIAGNWLIGIVLVILFFLLISVFLDSCISQKVEVNISSPDSSKTELGPQLEINTDEE